MLENLFLCKGFSEREHGSDTSLLFDLQHSWLPLRGLAHNNGASFECLLSHCAEADRCSQAQFNACREPQAHNLWCGRTWNPTGVLSLEPINQRFFYLPRSLERYPGIPSITRSSLVPDIQIFVSTCCLKFVTKLLKGQIDFFGFVIHSAAEDQYTHGKPCRFISYTWENQIFYSPSWYRLVMMCSPVFYFLSTFILGAWSLLLPFKKCPRMALNCFIEFKCSGQRVMDMFALCLHNVFLNFADFLCGLKLCRLLPSISCCKDGVHLFLVLESCHA